MRVVQHGKVLGNEGVGWRQCQLCARLRRQPLLCQLLWNLGGDKRHVKPLLVALLYALHVAQGFERTQHHTQDHQLDNVISVQLLQLID